jgi:hypothetical protein
MKRVLGILPLFLLATVQCGEDKAAEPKDASADGSIDLGKPPPPPPDCNGDALPTENLCTLHEAYGVFVSASQGVDDNKHGTRAQPLKTIKAALQGAAASGRRIYVCAETYPENVTFADGVSVFGNLKCPNGANWELTTDRAKIAAPPSADGIATRAKNIVKPTRIDSIEIVGANATTDGGSSIGLVAESSPGLVFANTRIVAGAAKAGTNGTAGKQLQVVASPPAADGLDFAYCNDGTAAQNASCVTQHTTPKGGAAATCNGAPSIVPGPGGAGAKGSYYTLSGRISGAVAACLVPAAPPYNCYLTSDPPFKGEPSVATPATNQGGGYLGGGGLAGAAGAGGSDGNDGVVTLASALSAAGFVPAKGTPGTDGKPGQGGGGGANGGPPNSNKTGPFYSIVGAGGGAGGCPGMAGTPGSGGGASIAVVAIESPFKADAKSSFEGGPGGQGGSGGAGSAFTAGVSAGANPSGDPISSGGAGGAGGAAGRSGSGASGPSIGIAYRGAAPTGEAKTIAAPAAPSPQNGGPEGLSAPTSPF